MKTAFIQLAIVGLAYGYVVTTFNDGACGAASGSNSLDLPSDGSCTGIVEGVQSIQFQSAISCELTVFDNDDCSSVVSSPSISENICFIPGFEIKDVSCK
jgi:hypothetical protein